jgi:hypothetical protein
VAETLDESILAKMHAPDKPDVPIITASQLTEPDGLIFGLPTRYGMMCAQMKTFFDSTGSLWQQGVRLHVQSWCHKRACLCCCCNTFPRSQHLARCSALTM